MVMCSTGYIYPVEHTYPVGNILYPVDNTIAVVVHRIKNVVHRIYPQDITYISEQISEKRVVYPVGDILYITFYILWRTCCPQDIKCRPQDITHRI